MENIFQILIFYVKSKTIYESISFKPKTGLFFRRVQKQEAYPWSTKKGCVYPKTGWLSLAVQKQLSEEQGDYHSTKTDL